MIEAEVRGLFKNSNGQTNTVPVAIGKQVVMSGPRYRSGNINGVMTITHREYLGEVAGSTTFAATSYPINPGLGSSFPWLSGIANSYEKYRIKSMTYEYVNIAATSERGRITLAIDYDVLDVVPTNKVDLFQLAGASEGPIWEPLKISVKPSSVLYTRNGTLSNVDLKTYDAGRFIAAISNSNDTSIKGELFVTYEIELQLPQPAKCPGSQIAGTIASWNGATPFLNCTTTGPLSGFSNTSTTLSFAMPGTYHISFIVTGTGTTAAPTLTASGGGELTYGTFSGGYGVYVSYFTSTVPDATLQYNVAATLTNATVRVLVSHYNNYTQ